MVPPPKKGVCVLSVIHCLLVITHTGCAFSGKMVFHVNSICYVLLLSPTSQSPVLSQRELDEFNPAMSAATQKRLTILATSFIQRNILENV